MSPYAGGRENSFRAGPPNVQFPVACEGPGLHTVHSQTSDAPCQLANPCPLVHGNAGLEAHGTAQIVRVLAAPCEASQPMSCFKALPEQHYKIS